MPPSLSVYGRRIEHCDQRLQHRSSSICPSLLCGTQKTDLAMLLVSTVNTVEKEFLRVVWVGINLTPDKTVSVLWEAGSLRLSLATVARLGLLIGFPVISLHPTSPPCPDTCFLCLGGLSCGQSSTLFSDSSWTRKPQWLYLLYPKTGGSHYHHLLPKERVTLTSEITASCKHTHLESISIVTKLSWKIYTLRNMLIYK